MKIIIESTSKLTELNGIPARIWEGKTDSGINIVCFVTRIAVDENEPKEIHEQFRSELKETRKPSKKIESIPARLIL